MKELIATKIYAGLLGKMIGVYLGRPVEGWPYEEIIQRFDQLDYYVNKKLGLPYIVADDDLSGTSTFFRAIADHGYDENITAKQIGDTWLNYIIEDRTILWWGGIGNSTEHTVFLRLKNGMPAPQSGKIETNGTVLATQVGSQIFMEEFAMMCPGDPDKAASFVERAVSVSHDGIALEGACFLAALNSIAFVEQSNTKNFAECKRFIKSKELMTLVEYVEDVCAKHSNWRDVRDGIGKRYGYDKYLGPAPFETNHAMVLAGILSGGDDFAKSVMIGASAGWDTDCNAGNIGCYNGIRLGLEGIEASTDFRSPIADQLLVVSSDGGECVTDAVQETRKVMNAITVMGGGEITKKPRFGFEYPGSVQGFMPCPYVLEHHGDKFLMTNEGNGLELHFSRLAHGTPVSLSTATFFDINETFDTYEMYGSPTLYEGQTIVAHLEMSKVSSLSARMFVWHTDQSDELFQIYSSTVKLMKGRNNIEWEIPSIGGMPILRFGLEFSSYQRCNDSVVIRSIDWSNTPKLFKQEGILMKDMWDLSPFWAKAFVPSAKIFTPNLKHTYCLSHFEEHGLATIGTRDFSNYQVQSRLSFSLHESGGLVARANGHRRYYAALFSGGNEVKIIKVIDSEQIVLAQAKYLYKEFEELDTSFEVNGSSLALHIRNKEILRIQDDDDRLATGATGFVVNRGSVFIDDFIIRRV